MVSTLEDKIDLYSKAASRHRKGLDTLHDISTWMAMNADIKTLESLKMRLGAEIELSKRAYSESVARLTKAVSEVEL